jgi:hypothetical protein
MKISIQPGLTFCEDGRYSMRQLDLECSCR